MKLIIAGSRRLSPTQLDVFHLVKSVRWWSKHITEIVSGGCSTGVDVAAKRFASEQKIEYREFAADWDAHGKAAGPIRNRAMAQYADALLLIWDGNSRGSASMLAEARHAGLTIQQVIREVSDG